MRVIKFTKKLCLILSIFLIIILISIFFGCKNLAYKDISKVEVETETRDQGNKINDEYEAKVETVTEHLISNQWIVLPVQFERVSNAENEGYDVVNMLFAFENATDNVIYNRIPGPIISTNITTADDFTYDIFYHEYLGLHNDNYPAYVAPGYRIYYLAYGDIPANAKNLTVNIMDNVGNEVSFPIDASFNNVIEMPSENSVFSELGEELILNNYIEVAPFLVYPVKTGRGEYISYRIYISLKAKNLYGYDIYPEDIKLQLMDIQGNYYNANSSWATMGLNRDVNEVIAPGLEKPIVYYFDVPENINDLQILLWIKAYDSGERLDSTEAWAVYDISSDNLQYGDNIVGEIMDSLENYFDIAPNALSQFDGNRLSNVATGQELADAKEFISKARSEYYYYIKSIEKNENGEYLVSLKYLAIIDENHAIIPTYQEYIITGHSNPEEIGSYGGSGDNVYYLINENGKWLIEYVEEKYYDGH
jgi:hypothetical protein